MILWMTTYLTKITKTDKNLYKDSITTKPLYEDKKVISRIRTAQQSSRQRRPMTKFSANTSDSASDQCNCVGYCFQGPNGRDIKTTVKIINILFATFSHTYQLLLYTVDAPTYTFVVAWYQLSYTLVVEASRMCFEPILYACLQLTVPKCCPPTTVSYEERDENHREPSPGRWWWVIEHFPSKTLQEHFCSSFNMRPSTVMEKDNTWGHHSSSLVLNKGIKLQHELHIWWETIVLGMFTSSLRAQNWQVQCVAIDGHTIDIAQHLCAKLHLILTVVLISRPSDLKKKSPRI